MRKFLQQINEGLHDMCYIWAKEMRNTIMDEGVLIFFILVPLIYPVLYSWIYNNEVVRDVPVAIVDMDNSSVSRQFVRQFDASPNTKAAYNCHDMIEAQDLVQKQVVHGIVYIPQEFSKQLGRMEQATISVYCDMALLLTYKAIYQTAMAVATNMNSGIQIAMSQNTTDREDQLTAQPLAVEEVQIYNPTGGYGNFILPGVLILILQQTLLLGIGLSAGTARENNRYQDLVPLSKHYNGLFRIVLGKSLCYFMVYSVMAAYIVLAVPRMFHFTSLIHYPDLIALMVPYLLSCIFFGMFVSCVVRYRENVLLLVVFTSVPLLFLAGVSWPQSNIPGFWQGVSWIFPSTWGVRGFLRLNSMGATLADIRLEYRVLLLQIIVYFFAACAVYRYQINKTIRHAHKRVEHIKQQAQLAKQKKLQQQSE